MFCIQTAQAGRIQIIQRDRDNLIFLFHCTIALAFDLSWHILHFKESVFLGTAVLEISVKKIQKYLLNSLWSNGMSECTILHFLKNNEQEEAAHIHL